MVVRYGRKHLRVRVERRVLVVDAPDLGALGQDIGPDLNRAQSGRSVGSEVGIARTAGEHGNLALLEGCDGCAATVRLGDRGARHGA